MRSATRLLHVHHVPHTLIARPWRCQHVASTFARRASSSKEDHPGNDATTPQSINMGQIRPGSLHPWQSTC